MQKQLYISVQIPTKPYLRKFLEHNLPANRQVGMQHLLGRTVIAALQKPKNQLYHSFAGYTSTYTDCIIAKLPESIVNRAGMLLEKEHNIYLNNLWDMLFDEVLFATLDVLQELHPETSFRVVMDTLLDRYNITETELSYETLRKRYYRYRKNIEKSLVDLSPM